jgi:hypothetical protein
MDLPEIAPPAAPAADHMRLFVEDVHGFSFYSFRDAGGMTRKIVRDSVFVGYNNSGSTIAASRIVYASGATADVPTIALAKADSLTTMPAIGVTIETIANGAYGRVMQVGLLEDVNTSAYSSGDVLYVSAATGGVPTSTPPTYPNVRQEIGTILVSDAAVGSIQIVARSVLNETIIDHDGLLNFAANEHFTEASIDHANILNVGTKSHATLDTEVAANTAAQHVRSHAVHGADSDHTGTAYRTLYVNSLGRVRDLAHGAAGTVLTSNGASADPSWAVASAAINLKPGLYISNAAVDPINSTATLLSLDTEQLASSAITFSAANNSIILDVDGTYLVEYDACFTEKDTLGAARGTVETWLEDDSGGSSALSPGSYGRTYIRETSYSGACHGSTFITRSGTDVEITVWAQRIYTANPNIKATAQGTSLKVMKVS